MIFRINFKTPDALDYVLERHMDTHCENHEEHDEDCTVCLVLEDSSCAKIDEIRSCAREFIEHDECITIEFDTKKQTATVVPVGK